MLTDIRTWTAGSEGAVTADLLVAARTGDARAFRSLFDALAPIAWRTALILTGETTGAADAVATGAGRAFGTSSASSAQIPDPTIAMLRATWLAALDILHRDRRRGDGPGNTEAEASEPPVTAETNLDAALVSFAFLTMPEQSRGALWLTEAEGLSSAVAGAVLDLVPSAFSQLLDEARAGFIDCGPRVESGEAAGSSRPAQIGDVSSLLRPALGDLPSDLDATAAERWQAALVSRTGWHRLVKSVAERATAEVPILRRGSPAPFGAELAPAVVTSAPRVVSTPALATPWEAEAANGAYVGESAVARIRAIIAKMDESPPQAVPPEPPVMSVPPEPPVMSVPPKPPVMSVPPRPAVMSVPPEPPVMSLASVAEAPVNGTKASVAGTPSQATAALPVQPLLVSLLAQRGGQGSATARRLVASGAVEALVVEGPAVGTRPAHLPTRHYGPPVKPAVPEVPPVVSAATAEPPVASSVAGASVAGASVGSLIRSSRPRTSVPPVVPSGAVVTPVKPVVTPVKPVVTPVKPVVIPVKPVVIPVKPVVTSVKPVVVPPAEATTPMGPTSLRAPSAETMFGPAFAPQVTASDQDKGSLVYLPLTHVAVPLVIRRSVVGASAAVLCVGIVAAVAAAQGAFGTSGAAGSQVAINQPASSQAATALPGGTASGILLAPSTSPTKRPKAPVHAKVVAKQPVKPVASVAVAASTAYSEPTPAYVPPTPAYVPPTAPVVHTTPTTVSKTVAAKATATPAKSATTPTTTRTAPTTTTTTTTTTPTPSACGGLSVGSLCL